MAHNRTYRPWGFYESLIHGERFQVKRIVVSPGGKLSLQSHFHRAEHWVVVNGTARVTRDAGDADPAGERKRLSAAGLRPPSGKPRENPADPDRGAVGRLSGGGRYRADRGHLRPGVMPNRERRCIPVMLDEIHVMLVYEVTPRLANAGSHW